MKLELLVIVNHHVTVKSNLEDVLIARLVFRTHKKFFRILLYAGISNFFVNIL